jgi:DNA-binding NarL/FixJ family response regulator
VAGVTLAVRVVVVDDDPLVRAALTMMLDGADGIAVVGEAADGDEVSGVVDRHPTDVVLMDIRMPRVNGIVATRRLRARPNPPYVIVLTTFDTDDHVIRALRAGASGFLLKDAPGDELVHAVRVIAAGDALLAPSVTKRLIADFTARRRRPLGTPEGLDELTARELEVLRLIARGMSNAEISRELFIAEQTTKTHVGRILMKLHLRDRVQAVVLAYESGLVAAGE